MVTLKDIAVRCGLSTATVSKALNGMPDISPATAERVRETARQMGYKTVCASRAQRDKRAPRVAIMVFTGVLPLWEHRYFAEMVEIMQQSLDQEGYDVTVVGRDALLNEESYLSFLHSREFDGAVILAARYDSEQLLELIQSDFPLVTIDKAFPNHSAVLSDNQRGMQDLMQYVLSMGHKRIAFIHGNESENTNERINTYYNVLREKGMPVRDGYLIASAYNAPEGAYLATRKLLSMAQPPSCILYPDDYSALGGMRAFYERRLRVPDDISMAGYDGTHFAEAVTPKLTTLRQDADHIGRMAAELLMRAMNGADSVRHVKIAGRLVYGASVRRLI